jgi:hypothetical protein
LLLEKLGINAVLVGGFDDGDNHMYTLVQDGGNWSFDDVTLGIIAYSERENYFDYDDLNEKKQTVIGVVPEIACDSLYYERIITREESNKRTNYYGLYDLPQNIKSTNKNKVNTK